MSSVIISNIQMTPAEGIDIHNCMLLALGDAEETRETERRRRLAWRPKQILCHDCYYYEFETICGITVTKEAHGPRVYPQGECPHQCTVCKQCEWCEPDDFFEYKDIMREWREYVDYGNDDLGAYGCPVVEPVRNRKVRRPKPVAVTTVTPAPVAPIPSNKDKDKAPRKTRATRRSHIRTHA
jgi:hypothetical protein